MSAQEIPSDMMVWLWLYAMGWFMAFCWPVSALMALVRRRPGRHHDRAGPEAGVGVGADTINPGVRP